MADEVERVEYQFEGDVSSLRDATETAISLLNQYSDSMKRASASGNFTASQRSTKSMQASVNRLTKDITKMQDKLQSVGDVKLPTGNAATQSMKDTVTALSQQVTELYSADNITTKSLNSMKSQLEGLRNSLSTTTPQVDKLIASEQRFQNVLGAVQGKADKFRNAMSAMQNRMSGTFEPINGKLKSLGSVFDGITAKVQSFRDRASVTFNRVSKLADACASAFRRVSTESGDADAAASRSAKAHGSLSDALARLSSKFTKETEAISDEDKKLDDKNSTLRKSTSEHGRLSQALKRLGNLFNQERSSLNSLTRSFTTHNRTLGVTRKLFVGLTGVQVGRWLMGLTNNAAAAIENLNLFAVAMGDSFDIGLDFVKQMQEIYGMDPSNLYRYAGYFYQLTDAIGMTDKASTSLSLSLTKASNDIASLFNVPIEQVVENLASGMQGMSRAVRKYGIDIRATTLQQTAAEYGLTQQVETMSEANRMALRYITMLKQVQNALSQTGQDASGATTQMGDFARTIETPTNQLRIFKEQISQLGRAIGNFLLVPLSKVIAYINGFVMALRMAINFVGSLFGVLQTNVNKVDAGNIDDVASSVAGVGDSAKDAAKQVQNLLSPFDELNILKEESADAGGGGGVGAGIDDVLDPSLEKAIEDMELKLDNIRMKANQVRDALLDFFGFQVDAGEIIKWDPKQFEDNLINKFPQWTKTIQATFDHWGEIVDGFKTVFKALGGVVDNMKKKILDFFSIFINDNSVSQFISNLGGNLQNLADWITQHEDGIANFALTLIALWGAFKLFSGVATILGPVITTFTNIMKVLSPLSGAISGLVGVLNPVTAAVAAVIAVFALAYAKFETVRDAVDDLKDSFSQMAGNVSETFKALWTDVFKPVLDNIASGLKELWSNHLAKLVEEIGLDVAAIIDFVMSVVDVVSELITFLSSTFGPIVSTVINTVVNLFNTFLGAVSDVVTRVLAVLRGLITFITGVFQGNWSKAWNGIVTVFKNVFGLVKDILKGIVNVCIDLLNGLVSAVWNAVRGIINGVGTIAQQIGELLGKKNWGWKLTAQPPRIPHLKTGGVVTGPTYALIGEGGKDEAVIPLDNSPQMAQLVQQIADAVRDIPRGGGSGSTNQPIEVRVFLDSREITSAQNRNNRMYGKNTQNV